MTDGKTIWKNIWPIVLARSPQGWRWLMAPRDPITWAALRAKPTTLSLPSTNAGRFAVLVGIVLLLLLVLPWYAKGHKDEKGVVTYPNAALINPILAGIGATLLIYAAIRQAQTANSRHEAQTEADLQRRITESFSKAIEQLGSDKLEVRLGGIYALERISQESPQDHWTVMENLTAFVRERTQRTEAERTIKPLDQRIAECAYLLWEKAGRPEGRNEEFWNKAVEQETTRGEAASHGHCGRADGDQTAQRGCIAHSKPGTREFSISGRAILRGPTSRRRISKAPTSRGASRGRQPHRGASRRRQLRGRISSLRPPRSSSRRRPPRRGASRRCQPLRAYLDGAFLSGAYLHAPPH